MPSANTYTINPNQTRIVGDGHLTVAMVGAPGNDAIMLAERRSTPNRGQPGEAAGADTNWGVTLWCDTGAEIVTSSVG
jgi:hypothetical protein